MALKELKALFPEVSRRVADELQAELVKPRRGRKLANRHAIGARCIYVCSENAGERFETKSKQPNVRS